MVDAEHLLFNTVYIVTMYRFGKKDSHNYFEGVYDSYDRAKERAEEERLSRGRKYEYEIQKCPLNKNRDEAIKLGMLETFFSKEMQTRNIKT